MKKMPWYRSLRVRLPLIVTMCCIVPVLIFSYYSNGQTRQKVMEDAQNSIYTNLYGSTLLLEQLMTNVASFSTNLCEDEELRDYIGIYMSQEDRREWARSSISLHFSQNFSSLQSLSAIYLIWEKGDAILSTDIYEKEISTAEGWGAEVQEIFDGGMAGQITWCYLPVEDGHGGLCYLRPVNLGDDFKKCSLICEIDEESWSSALQTSYFGSSLYVCNYSGEILLSRGTEKEGNLQDEEMFREAFESGDNYGTYETGPSRERWLVMYYNSVENGWKYVTCVGVEEILADIGSQMRMPYIMILIGIFSAAMAAVFLNQSVIRPLAVLNYNLEQMEQGNLVPIENIRQKDETGIILQKYNHMIGELRRMIDEIYVQRLLRKQAQLYSLQSQMDEHFLYNTLNTIYCEACSEQADSSAHMLLILSKYFRLSLAEGRDKAPLSEIVELMRYYLAIQKTRFGQELEVRFETFPGMEEYVALKYLFQPVVENAIVHGFEKKLGNHVISITMRKEEGELLYFGVKDDGNGIPQDKLEWLRQEMHTLETVEGEGYALKNIREQIRITYGEEYTIQIQSQVGVGTEVSFRIPLERVEGRKRDDGILDDGG